MSFRSAFIDCVHIVRWLMPHTADVGPLVREVSAARASFGKVILGIAIMPVDSKPPSDDARVAMGKAMGAILDSIETVHFVMEGSGFGHSVRRSALSGVLLLGGKRGRVVVHASVEDALREIAPRLGISVDEFKKRARTAGVFADPPVKVDSRA